MDEYNKESDIHHKLNFIAYAYTTLHNEIIRRRLPEDDFTINQIKKTLHEISKITHQFSEDTKTRETFRMPDEFVELIQTMKFIAKRMDGIEKRFNDLERLEFRHSIKINIDSSEIDRFNSRHKGYDPYEELLKDLPDTMRSIVMLRYGVYGKPLKLAELSKKFKMNKQKISHTSFKGICMCRNPDKTRLVEDLPESTLKSVIMGKK